jgi:hypothetical protein
MGSEPDAGIGRGFGDLHVKEMWIIASKEKNVELYSIYNSGLQMTHAFLVMLFAMWLLFFPSRGMV